MVGTAKTKCALYLPYIHSFVHTKPLLQYYKAEDQES